MRNTGLVRWGRATGCSLTSGARVVVDRIEEGMHDAGLRGVGRAAGKENGLAREGSMTTGQMKEFWPTRVFILFFFFSLFYFLFFKIYV